MRATGDIPNLDGTYFFTRRWTERACSCSGHIGRRWRRRRRLCLFMSNSFSGRGRRGACLRYWRFTLGFRVSLVLKQAFGCMTEGSHLCLEHAILALFVCIFFLPCFLHLLPFLSTHLRDGLFPSLLLRLPSFSNIVEESIFTRVSPLSSNMRRRRRRCPPLCRARLL